MTIGANHMQAHAGSRSKVTSQVRDPQKAFERARRHSRMVQTLKYALPAFALLLGGLYFISWGFNVSIGPMDASVERLELNRDALRMVNPKIEGITDDGGTFLVRAEYADQDIAQPTRMTLNGITAEVLQPDKGWSRLAAPRGRYDSKTEELELLDDIQVTSQSGLHAHMTQAAIDLKKQTVASSQPVRAEMPNGNVQAATLHINLKKSQLTFERDVRVHVERKGEQMAAAPAGGATAAKLNSRQPIDIAAPKLTIFDKDKLAHFTGGVATAQGASRLTSRELKVHYMGEGLSGEGEAKPEGEEPSADIRLIEAVDDVQMATEDGRQASGQHMLFDVQNQTLQLTGGVVLRQAGDVLTGEQLLVNLETGVSQFPPGTRVRGHIAARTKTAAAAKERKDIELGASQLDLSSSQGKPIDIEADTLTVADREHTALFKGNVHALQGDMTLRSRELQVDYTGDAQSAGTATDSTDGTQITKISARGRVLINSNKQDQTSTSDWAVFDMPRQTVTIGGNVVLSQGENVIKGDRLVIDLKTGQSRFENEGNLSNGQRVRGLFRPKSSEKKGRSGRGASSAPASGG